MIVHLFIDYPFSRQCWTSLAINWAITLNLADMFIQARQAHNLQFFTEVTLIAAWEIWKIRNDSV